jgi:DNA-binding NarL/FixJ family response regulator
VSGRKADAEVAATDLLLRSQPPKTEARLRLFLARQSAARGDHAEASVQAAAAESVEGLTPRQRARIAAMASMLPLAETRLDAAEAMATRSRRMGEEQGDDVTQAAAATTLATVAFHRGRFGEMRDWAERARLARDPAPADHMGVGWQHLDVMGLLLLGQAALGLDAADEAGETLRTARQVARSHGFRSLEAAAGSHLVGHGFAVGDWDDAVTEFDAVLDLCADLDQVPPPVALAAGTRALIALHRGEPQEVATAAIAVATGAERRGAHAGHLAELAQARLIESGGPVGEALALAAQAATWDGSVGSGLVSVALALGPDLVRLAVAQGDHDRAADACGHVEALAAANPGVATITGAGLRCRGLVEGDADLLVQAAAAVRAGPCPHALAVTCEDAAEALGRAGDVAGARSLVEEALPIYQRLEAAADIVRARARLRAAGVRLGGSRHHRSKPTTGWEALTKGERAVVELVAEGLSNPEVADRLFLSRHTVKRHLSNAMVKLGLTSRMELARGARQTRVT